MTLDRYQPSDEDAAIPLVRAAEQLLDERVKLGGDRERDFDAPRNAQALEVVLNSGFSPDDVHGAITRLMTQGRLSPTIGHALEMHPILEDVRVRIYGKVAAGVSEKII